MKNKNRTTPFLWHHLFSHSRISLIRCICQGWPPSFYHRSGARDQNGLDMRHDALSIQFTGERPMNRLRFSSFLTDDARAAWMMHTWIEGNGSLRLLDRGRADANDRKNERRKEKRRRRTRETKFPSSYVRRQCISGRNFFSPKLVMLVALLPFDCKSIQHFERFHRFSPIEVPTVQKDPNQPITRLCRAMKPFIMTDHFNWNTTIDFCLNFNLPTKHGAHWTKRKTMLFFSSLVSVPVHTPKVMK